MNKLLIANWKANPNTIKEASELFSAIDKAASDHPGVTTVIAPSFAFMGPLSDMVHGAKLGAQDISSENPGAHTGEVTAEMLKDLGVQYTLVGHSERRALGETDEMINRKLKNALAAGITPVLLVGELEKNEAIAQDVLVDQLSRGLDGIDQNKINDIRFVYEPSWAISGQSGNVAVTPDDVLTAISFMRGVVAKLAGMSEDELQPFLYGGSINPTNAHDLFQHEAIGGGVIGGASLKPDQFEKLINITNAL